LIEVVAGIVQRGNNPRNAFIRKWSQRMDDWDTRTKIPRIFLAESCNPKAGYAREKRAPLLFEQDLAGVSESDLPLGKWAAVLSIVPGRLRGFLLLRRQPTDADLAESPLFLQNDEADLGLDPAFQDAPVDLAGADVDSAQAGHGYGPFQAQAPAAAQVEGFDL